MTQLKKVINLKVFVQNIKNKSMNFIVNSVNYSFAKNVYLRIKNMKSIYWKRLKK